MEIKSKLHRFYRWEYFWLFVIVLATLILHFSIIAYPSSIILDEVHYVNDAKSIISDNGTQRLEHPPLGKLFVAAGIKMFGDNPWGWRVLPIIFGTGSIVLFYFICRKLNMSRTASSIATYLLATENLFFMLSGLAMLDVYCVTFMMASFLLYLYQRYINSGIAIGLSGLAKLNGALAGPTVFIHWILTRQGRSKWFMLTVIFAVISFFGLMPVFNYIIKPEFTSFLDPIKSTLNMLSMSGSLTFEFVTHPSESPPWEWLYTYKPMPFNYMPHWTAAISFTIWVLIIPTFAYMVYRAIKKDEAGLFGAAWFFATYIIWIPATIVTQRVTYIYYFYPAVGAICLGVGMGLGQLIEIFKNRPPGHIKRLAISVVIIILALHLISFLILSPFIPVDFAKLVGFTTIQP